MKSTLASFVLAASFGSSAALALLGCGSKAEPSPDASSSAAVSAPPSSSAPPAALPTPPAPIGTGIASITPLDKAGCSPASAEIATYLQRGELTLAAKEDQIAMSWLVQLRDDAQIGFGGYDGHAKRLARDRGIGKAKKHPPTLFATNAGWIVTWYDPEGLAFARPKWEPELSVPVGHLTTMRDVKPDDLSLAPTEDGAIVAASPFGTAGDQLTLFKFTADVGSSQAPVAIGITKQATKPHRPLVSADSDGYALIWLEADNHAQSIRFDATGNHSGGTKLLLSPGDRSDWSLVRSATGFQLTWTEGGQIITLALNKDVTAAGPPIVIGKGRWGRAIAVGPSMLIGWVGTDGDKPEQVLVAKLDGEKLTSAVRVTDGALVKDPPGMDRVGDRLAVFYTEPVSPTVASKRANLRTIRIDCIK